MLDPQAKALLDPMPAASDFDAIPLDVLRSGMAAQSTLGPGDPIPVRNVEGDSLTRSMMDGFERQSIAPAGDALQEALA